MRGVPGRILSECAIEVGAGVLASRPLPERHCDRGVCTAQPRSTHAFYTFPRNRLLLLHPAHYGRPGRDQRNTVSPLILPLYRLTHPRSVCSRTGVKTRLEVDEDLTSTKRNSTGSLGRAQYGSEYDLCLKTGKHTSKPRKQSGF